MKSILFIIKNKMEYGPCHHPGHEDEHGKSCPISGGLFNSAKFVEEMLEEAGVKANLAGVVDNNDIDKEVSKHKPDICVLEALWVVPSKFDVLVKLHPKVKWVIRIHSKTPFLSQEGIAIKWLLAYLKKKNVYIAFNSPEALADFSIVLEGRKDIEDRLLYLPNYYPLDKLRMPVPNRPKSDFIDIGCFGSIRPFKNQFIQAIAAVKLANISGKRLRFHINASRVEQGGENAYKNLRALLSRDSLVEYPWMSHEDFLNVLNKNVDVGMQVSFTESFNIVAADYVAAGLPIVVSPEISWASRYSKADPNSTTDIVNTLKTVTRFNYIIRYLNEYGLSQYSEKAKSLWLDFLKV